MGADEEFYRKANAKKVFRSPFEVTLFHALYMSAHSMLSLKKVKIGEVGISPFSGKQKDSI
uniref:Uncharacterized protein n=1 Tax=Utricularia reniformis TaxID=192314 RepID=A0A1Y0B0L9_9LAMI|nr:hypothetical protein AEK19_MT0663 [Utricularia reniformis]ART30914.1 hypothetical protein AEK19_MT0663 [Utricularia reniformis]